MIEEPSRTRAEPSNRTEVIEIIQDHPHTTSQEMAQYPTRDLRSSEQYRAKQVQQASYQRNSTQETQHSTKSPSQVQRTQYPSTGNVQQEVYQPNNVDQPQDVTRQPQQSQPLRIQYPTYEVQQTQNSTRDYQYMTPHSKERSRYHRWI